MRIRPKLFIFIFIAAALVMVGFHSLTKAIEADVNWLPYSGSDSLPEAELVASTVGSDSDYPSCLPPLIEDAQMIAEQIDKRGYTYEMWRYSYREDYHDDGFNVRIILMFGDACGIAYDPQIDAAITDRIQLGSARALTRQMYEYLIDLAGGVDTFRDSLVASLSRERRSPHGPVELTSVNIWALADLGIEVPEALYTVRDIDHEYQYNN